MEIQQRLITRKYSHIRPGIPMRPKYITIHETANTAKGASAEAHARLLEKGNTRIASWHFTVDDQTIIQHIPTEEVAWHCGDGRNGTGNRKSIGIEICVNADSDFHQAKSNAVWLIRHLMSRYGIPLQLVVPHKHWTGKNCPAKILPHWEEFVKQIADHKISSPSYPYCRLIKLTRPMMRGNDIKMIQEKLGVQTDGIYGPITQQAVKNFQKKHSLKVDGIVGPRTWEKLFS